MYEDIKERYTELMASLAETMGDIEEMMSSDEFIEWSLEGGDEEAPRFSNMAELLDTFVTAREAELERSEHLAEVQSCLDQLVEEGKVGMGIDDDGEIRYYAVTEKK
jgi:hypothetical protein